MEGDQEKGIDQDEAQKTVTDSNKIISLQLGIITCVNSVS
jgi:hypothetical protein